MVEEPVLVKTVGLLVAAQAFESVSGAPFDTQPPVGVPQAEEVAAVPRQAVQPGFVIEVGVLARYLPGDVLADGDVLCAVVKLQVVGRAGAEETMVGRSCSPCALESVFLRRGRPGCIRN